MDVTLDGIPQKLYRYDVDDTPVNGITDVPPSSNWAFDHAADYEVHNLVVRKTSDETVNNSNVLQNDDELFFAVAANEVWLITVVLLTNSAANADVKVGLYGPAGVAFQGNYSSRNETTAHQNYQVQGIGGTAGLHGAAADVVSGVLVGILTVGGTAGNFGVRWAQFTAQASDTKVLTNSCLLGTQLA